MADVVKNLNSPVVTAAIVNVFMKGGSNEY